MSPQDTAFWQAVGYTMALDAIHGRTHTLTTFRRSLALDAATTETWDTCTRVCNDAARAALAQYDHLIACS